jgi:hypothetical protein
MIRVILRIVGLLLVTSLLGTPSAHANTYLALRIGSPAVRMVVPAPVATAPYGYVWQRAHYVWTGVGSQWVPGAWAPLPYAGAVWVPGRWTYMPRGRMWVQGFWRR